MSTPISSPDGHAAGGPRSLIDVPPIYRAGHARARAVDPDLADLFAVALTQGDPAADRVVAACAPARGGKAGWIARGIEGGPEAIPDAPAEVRDFFADIAIPPAWFDPARAALGCRLFHANAEIFITAFVAAVLIEGFATQIAKSFAITGKVIDGGVLRLRQNNRHLVEIFLPGGMARDGEGWKLSVRVRLMHARVRQLMRDAPEWEAEQWEVPLCAAQIAYATAGFSGRLLEQARKLGLRATPEEVASFMMIWRYSGHLMGVPEALQRDDEQEAIHLHRIGTLFEPPPGLDSILMANALIGSAPLVAGITAPSRRRAVSRQVYRLSRALLEPGLADALNFPKTNHGWVLPMLRARNRMDAVLRRWLPGHEARRRAWQFGKMMEISAAMEGGITYALPSELYAERAAAKG